MQIREESLEHKQDQHHGKQIQSLVYEGPPSQYYVFCVLEQVRKYVFDAIRASNGKIG